ncbi:MAG: hypothetical protein OXH59_05745 [Rhodospirillaceae bacterium]|nr:hypothetical protein [Rhodospirillaceae bacterium]
MLPLASSTQSGIDTAANAEPRRKNGRRPSDQNGCCTAASNGVASNGLPLRAPRSPILSTADRKLLDSRQACRRQAILALSGLATRRSSPAALPSIRIEQVTPNDIPVQHRLRGILEPFDGNGQIVEIFEITLDRLTDDFGAAPAQPTGRPVERLDDRIGKAGRDLLCHRIFISFNVIDIKPLQYD